MQSRQVQNFKINKMTKSQYSGIVPNQDEVYITTDEADAVVSVNNILPDANGNVTIPTGGTVDQTYNPSSANAQSGVAINGAGFLTSITSSDVTTALGYTPYNSSNPNGYTSNVGTVTSVNNVQPVNGNVTIAIPTVPTNISAFNNDSGYITGITSSDITTALGYTPYNSSNPSGYTSNVGTVTSVNNVQPVNGNVTQVMKMLRL